MKAFSLIVLSLVLNSCFLIDDNDDAIRNQPDNFGISQDKFTTENLEDSFFVTTTADDWNINSIIENGKEVYKIDYKSTTPLEYYKGAWFEVSKQNSQTLKIGVFGNYSSKTENSLIVTIGHNGKSHNIYVAQKGRN